MTHPTQKASPMITVTSLNAGYGKLEILHDISLTFAERQFTAVLGPNGSGKSTLMKSILGITTIHSGSITFDKRELVGVRTEQISKLGIAYVPQRENIFTDLTVRENLQLGVRTLPRSDRQTAMDEVHELFPILAKRAGQNAGQLSGGERQMVAMAIAWLTRPDDYAYWMNRVPDLRLRLRLKCSACCRPYVNKV